MIGLGEVVDFVGVVCVLLLGGRELKSISVVGDVALHNDEYGGVAGDDELVNVELFFDSIDDGRW